MHGMMFTIRNDRFRCSFHLVLCFAEFRRNSETLSLDIHHVYIYIDLICIIMCTYICTLYTIFYIIDMYRHIFPGREGMLQAGFEYSSVIYTSSGSRFTSQKEAKTQNKSTYRRLNQMEQGHVSFQFCEDTLKQVFPIFFLFILLSFLFGGACSDQTNGLKKTL